MIPLLALAAAGLLADGDAGFRPPAHRARGNLTAYFSSGDYPAEAIRRGEQGRVIFEIGVDSTGRVSACRIIGSSGSTILDVATCRILRERARLEPARDRHGRVVPDQVSSQVDWPLPSDGVSSRARAVLASYISDSDYPAGAIRNGEQGDVGFRLDVTAEGTVSDCQVVESSGSALLDGATCRIMRARARFTPARNSAGQAVADTVSARVRWVLPADEGLNFSGAISSKDYPAAALQRGEQGRVQVALAISPDGRVARCTVTHGSGSALLDATTCELIRARGHFTPAEGATPEELAAEINGFVDWVLPKS